MAARGQLERDATEHWLLAELECGGRTNSNLSLRDGSCFEIRCLLRSTPPRKSTHTGCDSTSIRTHPDPVVAMAHNFDSGINIGGVGSGGEKSADASIRRSFRLVLYDLVYSLIESSSPPPFQ